MWTYKERRDVCVYYQQPTCNGIYLFKIRHIREERQTKKKQQQPNITHATYVYAYICVLLLFLSVCPLYGSARSFAFQTLAHSLIHSFDECHPNELEKDGWIKTVTTFDGDDNNDDKQKQKKAEEELNTQHSKPTLLMKWQSNIPSQTHKHMLTCWIRIIARAHYADCTLMCNKWYFFSQRFTFLLSDLYRHSIIHLHSVQNGPLL